MDARVLIGTDNGLLDATQGPRTYPYLMLGPTERVAVLVDFGQRKPGVKLALIIREFAVGGGMGGMMGAGQENPCHTRLTETHPLI